MRLMPRSLLGQVMLALAVALLAAQAISATLLYRASEQRRELALMHAAAFQLLAGSQRSEGGRDFRAIDREMARPLRPRGDGRTRLPRRLRYTESAASPLKPGENRMTEREEMLAGLLETQGIPVDRVEMTIRPMREDERVLQLMRERPRLRRRHGDMPSDLLVVGLRQQGSDTWQVARLPVPQRDRAPVRTLVMQSIIMFVLLVGILYLVLRRITRPLNALAERTARFGTSGVAAEPLEPTGPDDVSRLITAHNAMEARIGAMLDEKDVMLGAIGHDLKTPLAALRVRVEGVEDATARERMAESIEDITRTLDDILSLARLGRANGDAERTDLSALAASVVEEFEDMGEPVSLAEGERLVAPVHVTWLKRGLRNLVTNALRYAGSARVAVLRGEGGIVLRVDDEGPGIPPDRIADMLEPFARGEASRNRATGGAGLGLTLARAVAEQHGGKLVLANRPEGGLRAEIRLPA
ncbi:ATP-binding protein [Qipengyuania gaetbuli]|uniref:ATP-binding protein n=1 Tax=Qipengyuania gaetbuli TaxID=266952 RepID=UPI001CD28F53|nr:ATP-binding protein [Qipengyuania gaetbuli]MCA0909891.1 HAMP domain-containing protein [Qipengyuania gaetbuli]